MNNRGHIASLILALCIGFSLNAQPLREYSLVSLMDGTIILDSDTGYHQLPYWGFGIDQAVPFLTLPGPTIYANEGDSVHIDFFNPSMEGHTIHLHGLDVDMENDGVPHTSGFVQENESFKYRFKATHAGNFLYHCHVTTVMHLALGMYGMVIVYPTDSSKRIYNAGPTYDRQYECLFSEMDARWNRDYTAIGGFLSYAPDLFLINGKNRSLIYNDTSLIATGDVGDTLLFRMMNVGYRINRVIFPAELASMVHTSDGRVLDTPYAADTLILYPGERYSVLSEVLSDAASSIRVDYLDPYRLAHLGTEYIPVNDSNFQYTPPVIAEDTTDTMGVGFDEIENPVQYTSVYPNPAADEAYVTSPLVPITQVDVVDYSGRWITSVRMQPANTVGLNTSEWQSGLYLVRIQLENGHLETSRLMVRD